MWCFRPFIDISQILLKKTTSFRPFPSTILTIRKHTSMTSVAEAPPRRTYNDAITALNGLQSNFAIIEAIRRSGGSLNNQAIPEMIEWLHRVGYQPADLNKLNIIHIAGTKGKGSTCAFISSILSQYQSSPSYCFPTKIGMFTSPHLRAVRERIQINGTPISESVFANYFFEVWDRLEGSAIREGRDPKDKPVYFRFLTLMAFHVYLSEGLDTVVLEVGIGGEYDSTNIIEKPTVTGITALGIDHVHVLGDTIERIAWHKAGIIKPSATAYTVVQPSGALQIIKERAAERGAHLKVVEMNPEVEKVELGLNGEFQKMNASLAVEVALEHLKKMGALKNDPEFQGLSPEVKAGLQKVVWPGRCEVKIDGKGVEWWIDGAHTTESLEAASTWFVDGLSKDSRKASKRRFLIFNQQTRDPSALIKVVHQVMSKHFPDPVFDHVIFCTNKTWVTGYKPEFVSMKTNNTAIDELQVQRALMEAWKSLDTAETHLVKSIEEAVKLVRQLQNGEEIIALATGSIHLIGGLLEVLDSTK